MSAYCTESDLYDYGIPRGGVPNAGRLVASVDIDTDELSLDMHGFDTGTVIRFRAEGATGALPDPLEANTNYYAIRTAEDTFQVSATSGGAAIDLLTAGARIIVYASLPIGAAISWASSIVDDMLPAHVVPLADPVPDIVRSTTAELAAGKLAARTGSASKSLGEIVEQAHKRLARWAKHVPIRGTNAPESASLAVSSSTRRVSDWTRYGGIS